MIKNIENCNPLELRVQSSAVGRGIVILEGYIRTPHHRKYSLRILQIFLIGIRSSIQVIIDIFIVTLRLHVKTRRI